MGYAWLNIGSVLFGLITFIIPIIALIMQSKSNSKNVGIFSCMSVSACAISLCMQILYTNHLVNIEDWTALMDVLPTVANISMVFLVATIVINIIVHVICNMKKSQV